MKANRLPTQQKSARDSIYSCLVGRPKYNIKKVREKTRTYQHLRIELEKTRKLLFACRMIHHDNIFEEVNLTIFGRKVELTEHLIRLFQHSQNTLEELLPALSKCLDAKKDEGRT